MYKNQHTHELEGERAQLTPTAGMSACSPTGPGQEASRSAATGEALNAPDGATAALKRPRTAATFQLPSGEPFDLSEAGAAAFPDGMLSRLIKSKLTTDSLIPFLFPCDRDAFEYAIAVHEARAKDGDGALPPLTRPINPQSLAHLWEYLQLDFACLAYSEQTPLHILASQVLLEEQHTIAQELSLFLNALRREVFAMTKIKLRWPTMSARGSCSVLVWLGGCRKRWHAASEDLIDKWPLAKRHGFECAPEPLGFFSSDLFDLFRENERGALADIVRLYLPEREAECNALTLKPCTHNDRGLLQEVCQDEMLLIAPRLRVDGLMRRDAAQLLGGFAFALPILPTQIQHYCDPEWSHSLVFGSWEITVTATLALTDNRIRHLPDVQCKRIVSAVDSDDPHAFIASRRSLTFVFEAKALEIAMYDSQMPLIGVFCHEHALPPKAKLASRNAFFGSKRKRVGERDCTESLTSEPLSPSEYEGAIEQHGLRTFGIHDELKAVVPLASMDAPARILTTTLHPPSPADMQKIATAWDNSDVLGDDSCDAFEIFHFELHTLKPTASPYLESYSKERYGDAGARWAECAYLEIAGC